MNDESKHPRVHPSSPETPGGDDRALGGGGLAARVDELEELLEATRTKLAAVEAKNAEYAEMYPTFNANEHVASVVFSHVRDVRTRVALAQVNTVWRKASKHASSLPPSLDFTGCPDKWMEDKLWTTKCPMVFINEGMCIYWTTKSAYVLGIEGVLDLPETRFLDLLEQAGADFSCSAHQCNLGNFYDSAKRYDKALEWYMKGARQGCVVCEYNLGIYYKYGQGVEKNIDTALEWFTKSAEKGFAKGQYEAGRIHYDKERHDSAFQWFTISALQGNTAAIANLGECYEKGEGVKKDFPEAFKLYAKAAEKGHATAKKNIRRLANALQ
jgi:tetratricopeptide (TPR) repeat protein